MAQMKIKREIIQVINPMIQILSMLNWGLTQDLSSPHKLRLQPQSQGSIHHVELRSAKPIKMKKTVELTCVSIKIKRLIPIIHSLPSRLQTVIRMRNLKKDQNRR